MSSSEQIDRLRQAAPAVMPSLLLCDFGNLEREVARLEEAGVQGLHLDVMDGDFVPNFTYGMTIVEAFRRLTDLPLDVHLMISQLQRYLRQFAEAGSDLLTVHVEATAEPAALLQQIRELGIGAGLALNPATPLARCESCLDLCDLLLVMSVPAGFGGQAFDPVALEKLRAARQATGGRVLLEVDGGVNPETIPSCADAGAQLFVAGSAIFRSDDYKVAMRELTELATVSR